MCRRIQCPRCERPDWRGCGAHVEQVLGDVPRGARCECRAQGVLPASPGLFDTISKLLGRK